MLRSAKPPFDLQQFWQSLRKPLELEIAHGCPDTAIAGAGIGVYARLWADRLTAGAEEDMRLTLSLARGLRDYATMPVAERKRRAMAAIDLLRQREAGPVSLPAAPPKQKKRPAPARKAPRPKDTTGGGALPIGSELLSLPIEGLAPRANWPRVLADKMHIYTVRDLLYHIPRDWVAVSRITEAVDGARAAFIGTVTRREYDNMRSKHSPVPMTKYVLTITDGNGDAWVTAFCPTREAAGKKFWSPARLQFPLGERVFVLGKVSRIGHIVDVRMEDIFAVTETEAAEFAPGVMVPLYPLTAGVYQSQVNRAVLRALAALGSDEAANALVDPLPTATRAQFELLPLVEALQELHRPRSPELHEQARRRLAFEEFLIPQLVLARRRWEHAREEDAAPFREAETMPALVACMTDFTLTPAQERVLAEIESDLRKPRAMNRLLQGDVGSGKTLVAAGTLAFAVRAGFQAAIMAPTEILAEQLYLVLSRLLKPLAMTPVLLTGTVPAVERRTALAALQQGAVPIAVGTHALIQGGVEFNRLGLVVIDEQHRFGVLQRATLRGKGQHPHTLVMTATPIPRTLSLTAFGDLDMSVLDELPPGRHPVATRWLSSLDLREAYRHIRAQVTEGRQAYVLCPLVEQSEMLQADAAVEMAAELQRVFPELRVGLLHGRLRPDEKDAAMEAFRAGTTQLLACTTVVEVGVDVPNATIMLIHNAERFGLAQLHQLRGRVGRSHHPSTCYLVTHPRMNPALEGDEDSKPRRRLRIMLEEQDGFAIAEADLELRGPGEYLGTQQSGLMDFQIGSLVRDGKYLESARQAAELLIADDPDLQLPAHRELRRRVTQMKARLDQFRE